MKKRDQEFRCAIYTRKSSEEGLEQDFNSLDAQRAACEAYIASQTGEGWRLVPTIYDDGGFSGGTMDRPALQALLADIDKGRIDNIVVYKVDRLTRSLIDFGRMVERFDAKNVSFCSVTQAFNTSNSMGRLTLNMLLSFAQYEREITGERIRDKIAASKARGLWMGGTPLLGYKPRGRTLEVEPAEAEIVTGIFKRYLELKSVHGLQIDLEKRGIRSKVWVNKAGVEIGGAIFRRGGLYHLLRNRHYLGEIVHKDKIYPGQHLAIIDAELFAAVQAQLAVNAVERKAAPLRAGGSPLSGLIFDDVGNRMSPTHARGQTGTRHRYYVSRSLLTSGRTQPSIKRVPATEIEKLVAAQLGDGDDRLDWADARSMIHRIEVAATAIVIRFRSADLDKLLLARLRDRPQFDDADRVLTIKARFGARSGAVRLLDHSGRSMVEGPSVNQALVRALATGWRWRTLLLAGAYPSSSALGRAEGVTRSTVRRLIALAYLSPDLIREFLEGRQRPGLSLDRLHSLELPREWRAQERLLASITTP